MWNLGPSSASVNKITQCVFEVIYNSKNISYDKYVYVYSKF